MKVNCPTCQTELEWIEENTFRPFCSERCKLIDLGAWSTEEYKIPLERQDNMQDIDASESFEGSVFNQTN